MKTSRLHGLDFARFLAFFGMVIVNFQVVMRDPAIQSTNWLEGTLTLFEGKAAATFVVLAGIGVGLAFQRAQQTVFRTTMLKRSLFLLAIGLINMTIFDADIIHYYAFYFAIGIWFLPLGKNQLLIATAAIILAFPLLQLVANYDTGWNWDTLTYSGMWTIGGFLRNLTFNGWHPIVPWLGFFTFGMYLSKLNLSNSATAASIAILGAIGSVVTPILSAVFLVIVTPTSGADAAAMFATAPIPPGPFYMLAGISAAMLVVGLCLLVSSAVNQNLILKTLCKTGQQTLTLYFTHILIGMGIIEAMGLIGTTSAQTALGAAALFVVFAIIYVAIWNQFFKRGPLEELMRRTAG